MRKWRAKNTCKICKGKDSYVIKCSNTKCKSYFHVSCAIEKKMIIALDFMSDFYNLPQGEDDSNKNLPFYCSVHNRTLIDNYNAFLKDLECVLKENENTTHSLKDHKTEDVTNCDGTDNNPYCEFTNEKPLLNKNKLQNEKLIFDNLENFESPKNILDEKNYINYQNENFLFSVDKDKETIMKMEENFENFKKKINPNLEENFYNCCTIPKPIEESFNFNFNFQNFPLLSECNFISIENNNNFNLNFEGGMTPEIFPVEKQQLFGKKDFKTISKQFFDYIDNDISKMQVKNSSEVTVTDLKSIKDCFLKVLKSYGSFEPDLKKIKEVLESNYFI